MRHIEYKGCVFFENGTAYKNGKELTYYKRIERGKTYFRVRIDGIRIALPTLICNLFNGESKHRNLIFKDRNTLNIHADNLMFIDDCNFKTYSKWQRKILKNCPTKAYLFAKNELLKNYYLTGNEIYIYECWEVIKNSFGDRFREDIFDYFLDRCLRNSILGDPRGLMIMYQRSLFYKKITFNENII